MSMKRTKVKGAGDEAREVTGAGHVGPSSDPVVAPKIDTYIPIPGACEVSLTWQM